MPSDPDRFAADRGRVDWIAWHSAYDSPSSSLASRIEIVRRRLVGVLAELPNEAPLLSLCAGDGRDVIEVRRRRPDWTGRAVLVEVDPELARRARVAAGDLDGVEVRCADASNRAAFDDVLPVEVLLLCGVFGNVDPSEVAGIVLRAASLLVPGGFAIWTRGGGEPDRRPEVRAAVRAGGFDEVSFDGTPARFGVGVARRRDGPVSAWDGSEPLFEFVR